MVIAIIPQAAPRSREEQEHLNHLLDVAVSGLPRVVGRHVGECNPVNLPSYQRHMKSPWMEASGDGEVAISLPAPMDPRLIRSSSSWVGKASSLLRV